MYEAHVDECDIRMYFSCLVGYEQEQHAPDVRDIRIPRHPDGVVYT